MDPFRACSTFPAYRPVRRSNAAGTPYTAGSWPNERRSVSLGATSFSQSSSRIVSFFRPRVHRRPTRMRMPSPRDGSS